MAFQLGTRRTIYGACYGTEAKSQESRMAEIEAAMANTLDEIAIRIEKIADQIEIR